MAAAIATDAHGAGASTETFENVPCPFCGLLCDDLEVARNGSALKILKNGCGKGVAGFERPLVETAPSLKGRGVSMDEAVREAAALLRRSRRPLFGGLSTDVDGVRAVLALAEKTRGAVDHAQSESQHRNYRVLQSKGWITTTLAEVRNRADLIVIAGTDVHKLHPRFFERVVNPAETMFGDAPAKRTVVFVGEGLEPQGATGARAGETVTIGCDPARVGEVLAAVRAVLRGAPVYGDVAGASIENIQALADRCAKASYGVVVWAPSSFDYAQADLTVEEITGLIADLNKTTRFAGLSLGGSEGSTTASAACAWQTGYPLRVSYGSGVPVYDPYRYATARMLASGEADALVWIASIGRDLSPPETDIPTIVLATPDLRLMKTPDVFMPVGTPGMDHIGGLSRVDGVVTAPMRNLHRSSLPRAADVFASIQAAL